MSIITLYQQPWSFITNFSQREEWFRDRQTTLNYKTKKSGESAAEEAFELTNAPKEYLTEEQQQIQKSLNYIGPSLSVGDIVKVESRLRNQTNPPDYYMCKSVGWEKFSGNTIQLLKHLSE